MAKNKASGYYTRKYGHERLTLKCDMTQAASPIYFCWDWDGESRLHASPYQTASARHLLNEAFRLVRAWGEGKVTQ